MTVAEVTAPAFACAWLVLLLLLPPPVLLLHRSAARYDPQFLGMLENPADGMGCWSVGSDTTLVGLVTNATFSNFAKLCKGGYGSRPLQQGHTLVAINPDWTGPSDIGQFWDR